MSYKTRVVKVKNLFIGGGNDILIQSMTNTDTLDHEKTLAQITTLYDVGCDIVRVAVSSEKELDACKNFLNKVQVPLVADIQFDYRLAVACADSGFDKIRFNPGNIGSEKNVLEVVSACKRNAVPIRIGVNAGSIDKNIAAQYGRSAMGLAQSALMHVDVLEKQGFNDIIVSVKSSSVEMMIEANRILAQQIDYPIHIGVTESGSREYGLVKSAIGIGSLLCDGIGDTIRVSLSGDPLQEIDAAKIILKAAGKKQDGVEIVSCPTCSRCKYDMMNVIDEIEDYAKPIKKPLKIAIMGCVVNGPGEASDADVGIAGGKDKSVIFKKGKVVMTAENARVVGELKKIIDEMK